MRNDAGIEFAEPDRWVRPTATTPPIPGIFPPVALFAPGGRERRRRNLPDAWISPKASLQSPSRDRTGYRQHADLAPVLPGYDFIPTRDRQRRGGRDDDARIRGLGRGERVRGRQRRGQLELARHARRRDDRGHDEQRRRRDRDRARRENSAGARVGKSEAPLRRHRRNAVGGGLAVSGVPANPNPAHVLNLSWASPAHAPDGSKRRDDIVARVK